MTNDAFDPWQFTSGLPDDFDGYVTDAVFGFNPQYMDGTRLVLMLTVLSDDDDIGEEPLMYPAGSGWEVKDRGETAVREDGKEKGFNQSSGMGLLCAAAIEAGAGDVLKERGSPMQASIWKGLGFHWNRKSFDYGGDIGSKERLVPTAYLGVKGGGGAAAGGGGGAAAAPAASTASAPAAADTPAATPPASGEVTGKTRVALIRLAKQCDTHDLFMEKAYDMAEVADNPAAQALVDTPDALYNEARASM